MEKVSQNIQDLIGEIGERMVLFKLYELAQKNPELELEIYKNYSESGYDVGIRTTKNDKKAKIEVKTRQRLITSQDDKDKNVCDFTLTKNEMECSNFLVGFWLEENAFFIMPTHVLGENKGGKDSKNNQKYVYKHILSKLKPPKNIDGPYSSKSMQWFDNWDIILNYLKD